MFTYCVRSVLSGRLCILNTSRCRRHFSASSSEDLDQVRTLLQLCVDRRYVSPGPANTQLFQRGMSCSYGPLGMELRRNLLEQWWHSVTRSTAQVLGINTLNSSTVSETEGQGPLRIVESGSLKQILEEQELSKEQLIKRLDTLLQSSPSVRGNLLQGRVLRNVTDSQFDWYDLKQTSNSSTGMMIVMIKIWCGLFGTARWEQDRSSSGFKSLFSSAQCWSNNWWF